MSLLCGSPAFKLPRNRQKLCEHYPQPNWGPLLALRQQRELEIKKAMLSSNQEGSRPSSRCSASRYPATAVPASRRPASAGNRSAGALHAPSVRRTSDSGGGPATAGDATSAPRAMAWGTSVLASEASAPTAPITRGGSGGKPLSRAEASLSLPGAPSVLEAPSQTEPSSPTRGKPRTRRVSLSGAPRQGRRRNSLGSDASDVDVVGRRPPGRSRRPSVSGKGSAPSKQGEVGPADGALCPTLARRGSVTEAVDPEVHEAFFKNQNKGGVDMGAPLVGALADLGHLYPKLDWLREILDEQCCGRQCIDEDDFGLFVKAFKRRQDEHLQQAFASSRQPRRFSSNDDESMAAFTEGGESLDKCDSMADVLSCAFLTRRKVVSGAVPDLLVRAGVPLMPGAAEELAAEAGKKPEVGIGDFKRVHGIAIARAGLSEREHKRLEDFFGDLRAPGSATAAMLVEALHGGEESMAMLAGGIDAVEQLMAEALRREESGTLTLDLEMWGEDSLGAGTQEQPADGSPGTNKRRPQGSRALFTAARVFHARAEQKIRAACKRLGLFSSAKARVHLVSVEDVAKILDELGYVSVTCAEVASFQKAAGAQNGLEHETALNFTAVYDVVFTYCAAGGIADVDREELDIAFRKFDMDESGMLDAEEVGPVIRLLGYQPSHYRMYDFALELGLSVSIVLDPRAFRTCIAKYKNLAVQAVRNLVFTDEAGIASKWASAPQLQHIMASVGHDLTEREADMLLDTIGNPKRFNFCDFKHLEAVHRKKTCAAAARNGGFLNRDLAKHTADFKRGDEDGKGTISSKHLRTLLHTVLSCRVSKAVHKRIANMVKDADADGNGIFDLDEFLVLMRNVMEELDRQMLVMALKLKDELHFDVTEVRIFRDMYMAADDDFSGGVDFNELARMLRQLISFEGEDKRELESMFKQVDGGDGILDMWDFFKLMRKVQDRNWRNINAVLRKLTA